MQGSKPSTVASLAAVWKMEGPPAAPCVTAVALLGELSSIETL